LNGGGVADGLNGENVAEVEAEVVIGGGTGLAAAGVSLIGSGWWAMAMSVAVVLSWAMAARRSLMRWPGAYSPVSYPMTERTVTPSRRANALRLSFISARTAYTLLHPAS